MVPTLVKEMQCRALHRLPGSPRASPVLHRLTLASKVCIFYYPRKTRSSKRVPREMIISPQLRAGPPTDDQS